MSLSGNVKAQRAYLVRFAEIGRDGQPGRQGVRNDLMQEIERELPGARVTALARGRILVECEQDAFSLLAAMPGVTSFSPSRGVALADVAGAAAELAAGALPDGGSFAVRVKRVGEQPPAPSPARHRERSVGGAPAGAPLDPSGDAANGVRAEPALRPFHSRELVAEVARAVREAVPGARVDLAAPELVLGIEVRGPDCHLFREVVPGVDRRGVMPWPGAGAPRRPVFRWACEVRFLADQMLGRLAVWLRLFGFDTAGGRERPDSWLLRQARDEGRVLLTQDRPLSRAASAATYYVEARDLDGQLSEVIHTFDLRFDRQRLFSRCTRCNRPIEKVAPESVYDRVPPAVRERQREFFRCPSCNQLYWEGDHSARILQRLSAHFPQAGSRPVST